MFKPGNRPWNKGLKKETCRRVAAKAAAQRARKREVSSETGKKISEALQERYRRLGRTKRLYAECGVCREVKPSTPLQTCVRCAQKRRAQEHPNNMKPGMLKSNPPWMKSFLGAPRKRGKTRPEIRVEKFLQETGLFGFRYTGSGKQQVFIQIRPDRTRIPDFFDREAGLVIEVFGRFWHPPEDEVDTISDYESVGYRCLVVWEDEEDITTLINEFVSRS